MSRSDDPAHRAEHERPRWVATRLARLEATIDDLARENRLLHRRLAELAASLSADGGASATIPGPHLASDTNLKDTLRGWLRRLRELWRATDPTLIGPLHHLLEAGPRRALPRLAAVFIDAEDSAELQAAMTRQTAAISEWIFWRRDDEAFQIQRGDGTVLRQGRARTAEELRRATDAAFLLTVEDGFTELSPTAIELAWLSLASEELAFIELPPPRGKARTAGLLVARELWRDDGVPEAAALEKRLQSRSRRLVGKILPHPGGGDRAWLSRPPGLRGWRQTGPYVIGDPARGGVIRHRLQEVEATAARPQKLAWMLLIDAPLAGGLEHFVGELTRRLAPSLGEPLVAALRASDELQAERLAALGQITPRVYPLADVLPGELHPAILAGWITGHGITTVVQLQGAEPATPSSDSLRHTLPSIAWHQLPGGPLPTSLGGEDAGWERRWWAEAAARQARTADDGASQSLRQRLGVPPETLLVSQIGDLIAARRPEDFVALAHHLRGDDRFFFLLRGRGPRRASVEDLATFFALDNFRLLANVESDAVLAASDIVCSTAEAEPWPSDLAAAMAWERPVVACAPGIDQLDNGDGGLTLVDVGDLDAYTRALRSLSDRETRQQRGAAARSAVLAQASEGV